MNPLSDKYDDLYMALAETAAQQSTSKVVKVGALLVLPSGLTSFGWNGTPPGFDNSCEHEHITKVDEITGFSRPKTKPETIHAERNAIDKLTREGVSSYGAKLYVTLAPCFECAKAMTNLGISHVVFKDYYKDDEGIKHLAKCSIKVIRLAAK